MAGQNGSQNNHQNNHKHPEVAVVLVPFPIQGHLNEILHLSCLLTAYNNIQVHYAGSSTHNRQAEVRIQGWNPETLSKIHFHDFQLPSFTSLPPDPSTNIKFPAHLQPVFDACTHLRQPVHQLLRELSTKCRRIIVIHDSLMASVVQDIKSIPNAESFALQSVSAFTIFFYMWDAIPNKPFLLDSDIPKHIPTNEGCFTPEFANFVANQYKALDFGSGRIFNTCRVMEGRYMDLLAKLPVNADKKLFALGPFNPVELKTENKKGRHTCLDWLDKQESNSVIYVSFGTSTSLTDEQVTELALALERSGQKFIWVLRRADKGDVFSLDEASRPQLPEGYEEKVSDRGAVVRDWVPQLDILGHPSVGGFMSHCGWNSCMESISMGVPIAAWPMHSDQPRNAILVTQVLQIGIEVRDWERRGELVTSDVIETAVRRLMASKEGNQIRDKAAELGRALRKSVTEGGCSRLERDSFAAYITR